ncbi:Pleckstrin domain-containing family O member 1-like protein [Leptotrombidium deliense]|uniref:Pleckstrin domain-containing family O member 1-like protein n=1 Tax=Leptotrombidium deliense TaxID=299467 RepID=A0A443SDH2_9ACAR|nr:Pleckstrin domain-containing family O member 1-like protein [Leptotrombidium deliense]
MDTTDSELNPIPAANALSNVTIDGYLNKQFPKNWWRLLIGTGAWKKRYCALEGNRLYYYESQVRHTFAANSKEEMHKWIESVRHAIKETKLGRKSGSTRRNAEKRLSHENEENKIEINLNGLQVDETLMNATKGRPKGPKGRRPPLRKSMQPQGSTRVNGDIRKIRANSMGFISENMDESEGNSSNSDTRKSRSLHSLDDQESTENAFDEDDDTKQSTDSEKCEYNQLQMRKQLLAKTQMNNKNKQISPLIQELQQRYATPQSGVRSINRSESDRSSYGMEDSRNGNKSVKDMNSFLGELKSNITEIEIEMYSLKKEMNKFNEKLADQSNDEFEIKEKCEKLDRMHHEAYLVLQNAKRAEDTYKMLINECQLLVKQLKSIKGTTNKSRSHPDFIDQMDNDSIGYI